jgi:GDP-L-fucose synthase
MVNWLAGKRITVTGGAGFLGGAVVRNLTAIGCRHVFVVRSKDFDLVDNSAVRRLYHETRPDIVIHIAAKVGGIGAVSKKPGEFFYENLMMGVQMMEQGRLFGVEKFVAIGTVCSYPKDVPVPSGEDDLWNGYPEETNASYGIAKKMTLVQAQAYRQQYGFNAIYLLPVNLYGPGDNFDPESSHAIPALIKKCVDAIENNEDRIVAWGTGKPTREYLFVKDAAEAIVLAAEEYNKPEPVNLGSGCEISIRDLFNLIAGMTGFKGHVVWDVSKPDGQPRRLFDSSKAMREFGFRSRTALEEGLRRTIVWYKGCRAKGLLR